MTVIEADHLQKSYKVHTKEKGLKGSIKGLIDREYRVVEAVKSISFTIEQGEMVGFIGQNGAGKTTTLKMLSGLLYPTAGYANVLGYTPWQRKRDYLRKISLVMGQKGQLWWDIPAYDSFVLNKSIYMLSEKEFDFKVKELSKLLEVEHLLKVPVRNLSLGERMKMEIIGSILHSPNILFLDEPTIGLDIISQKNLRAFLSKYNELYGTTMMLTSHYMEDIISLCKRIIIISHGDIIFDDKIEKVRELSQDMKFLKITFAELPDERIFAELNMKIKQKKEHSYVFQVAAGEINAVMRAMIELNPLDLSIEDQSIEGIIERIYTGGKRG